ncbi:MAG: hypothetical protein PHH83_05040 [Patescibacteria group bacterium]|nr:hypothetical protein [Patescibacteria group bacterium]
MKILQVQKYNEYDLQRYSKRYDEWRDNGGYNTSNNPPQQAFYCFYHNGNFRKTGYVAFDEHSAYLAKNKKEAIKKYQLNNLK